MSEQINAIHTPCKKCVFAKYDGKTQIDCELNYIEIYKNKNIEVLEVYDEDLEFYVINEKKCIGYREPKWFDLLGMSNSSLEEKIEKYNELNKIHYALTVDTLNMTLDQFEKLVENISNLKLPPQKLVVIRHIADNYQLPYNIIESTFKKYNINIVWRIKTVLDTELSRGDILHQVVGETSDHRFLLYTSDYLADLDKLTEKANDIVHKDFDQFNILTLDEDAKTIIFSIGVYRYANFMGSSILENKANYTVI